MHKTKSRKSLLKRLKITRNGKVLRRHTGQDHLGSKKLGEKERARRGLVALSKSDLKILKKLIKF